MELNTSYNFYNLQTEPLFLENLNFELKWTNT